VGMAPTVPNAAIPPMKLRLHNSHMSASLVHSYVIGREAATSTPTTPVHWYQ
jgi:hypothetical protein